MPSCHNKWQLQACLWAIRKSVSRSHHLLVLTSVRGYVKEGRRPVQGLNIHGNTASRKKVRHVYMFLDNFFIFSKKMARPFPCKFFSGGRLKVKRKQKKKTIAKYFFAHNLINIFCVLVWVRLFVFSVFERMRHSLVITFNIIYLFCYGIFHIPVFFFSFSRNDMTVWPIINLSKHTLSFTFFSFSCGVCSFLPCIVRQICIFKYRY